MALASLAGAAPSALAAPGAPDPSFGHEGLVEERFGPTFQGSSFDLAEPTAAGGVTVFQTGPGSAAGVGGIVKVKSEIKDIHGAEGGKVLVAGTEGVSNAFGRVGGDLVVSRFEDDGRIDRAYGTGGSTLVDFGGGDRLGAVLWGPDGSALLGGVSYTADPSCSVLGLCTETPVLARLSATGNLDAGFGEGGRVRLSGLTEPEGAGKAGGVHSFAARPDGGAYAAGASGTTAFVAGLEPSGGPVPGFGDDGLVTATYPGESSSTIRGVAVDDQDRILVLGNTDSGRERSSAFVRRLLPDGAPDLHYGDGAEFIRVPSARQILVDGRGRALLLMGYNVLRLNSNGTLDGSFGDRGVVTPHPRPSRSDLSVGLRAMTVLPSGGFLVAATLGHPTHRPAVFRFGANGSPDRSFGRQGKSELRLGAATFYFNATTMLVEPDGRILVGGYLNHHRGANETRQMMVVRLLPDGRLDRRFGTDGAIRPRTGPAASVRALALEHGKLLVAGTERGFPRGAVVVLRYCAGGRLDRGFGKDGEIREREPTESRRRGAPISLLTAPGRLFVVSGNADHPISAYRTDGSLVPGYGREASVVPAATGRRIPGPLALLQGKNPILAGTASRGSGLRVGRLQRLGAR